MAQMPVFNDFTAQQGEIARRRKMAEALQVQSLQPIEQTTAGGMVVPISPVQGLAKMLQAYVGAKGLQHAAAQDQALAGQKSQALAQALGAMPQATTSTETKNVAPWLPNDDEGNVNPSVPVETKVTTKPTAQQYATWLAGLGNIGQDAVQIGSGVMNFKQKEDEAEANRQQRMQELQLRLLDSRQTAQERMDLQRQLAEMQQSTQRTIAEGNQQTRWDAIRLTAGLRQPQAPVAVVGPDGKPMYVAADQAIGRQPYDKKAGAGLPPQILKVQNETLDEIGNASAINADLGAIGGQIASGGLKLGPVSNVMNAAQNALGISDQGSRNYASFLSTLEKLRNDSLRLNKGVQTEGDAQRAWNELIANANDPGVVAQRIAEIQKINQRAVALKQMQIDQMRANYGLDPLNTQGFANQPAAIGSTPQPTSPKVMRFDAQGRQIP